MGDAVDEYISVRENVLSPSTIRGYDIIRNNRFQHAMIQPMKAIQWQRVINTEAKLCSPRTLKNAWGFVKSVLRENDMDTPRVTLPAVPPAKKEWLEPEQIPLFLREIKGKPGEIPALMALNSMRRSEIFGCNWDDGDIDLERDEIRVRGVLTIDKNNHYVERDANKNYASSRIIPILIPQLHDALAAVQDKHGPVVKCDPTTPYKQIRAACERAGLPNVGVHGLRHSFASLAYHLGLSEMETMRIGGWSDYGTMRRIYTHLSQRDALRSENRMRDYFREQCGDDSTDENNTD